MKKTYKFFAGILCTAASGVLTLALWLQGSLPDHYYLVQGNDLTIHAGYPIQTQAEEGVDISKSSVGSRYHVDLRVMGSVSVKKVQVEVVDRKMVIPGGFPFGIKMFTDGVMVVGMSDVQTTEGLRNPSREGGLKIGDVILSINGKSVASNEQVGQMVAQSDGEIMDFSIKRKGTNMHVSIVPQLSSVDSSYRAGIWVRDSSAGIGTMTYYDPSTGVFAGLGHGVCDIDTGELMPLYSGEIVDVSITGVNVGKSGAPGELKGAFSKDSQLGRLAVNNETGVFGVIQKPFLVQEAVPLAMKHEVKEGKAMILTTLNGKTPEEFEIMIEKVYYNDDAPTKNMVIRVTDPALLAKTGGIIQGMSGSPILQDGKLIGAVTHVLVNDPTKGYGIFAENMEKTAEGVVTGYQIAS